MFTAAEARMPELSSPVDVLVVGGGANGCAIARDASGRGLSVVLCEAGDLAGATSSASSKLIHGGLRYLEQAAFRLVRESLAEREVLLAAAPHLIRPLRFVLPHHRGLRPAWMLRLGLFLYDHIGGRRTLPATQALDLRRAPQGAPLKPTFTRGYAYSDAWTDDARMVVLTARDAAEHGARILVRTRLVAAVRDAGVWRATLQTGDGGSMGLSARALVNAAGPWVDVVGRTLGVAGARREVKLVKGSHIVVPRLYDGDWAYTLQEADGRVVFVMPFEDDFTLVGTTDVAVQGDPVAVSASAKEVAYLCAAVNGYFRRQVTPTDVVWSYAGLRPLHDDAGAGASKITRDYALDLDAAEGSAPLLTVYGGKITTFRTLAEHAVRLLAEPLGCAAPAWTGAAPLPGGDLPDGFDAFRNRVAEARPWLVDPLLTRLCRAYGSRVTEVLGDARELADLGRDYGAGLTQRELDYLRNVEWARTAEDVLWRRSKLGLRMTPAQRDAVAHALG